MALLAAVKTLRMHPDGVTDCHHQGPTEGAPAKTPSADSPKRFAESPVPAVSAHSSGSDAPSHHCVESGCGCRISWGDNHAGTVGKSVQRMAEGEFVQKEELATAISGLRSTLLEQVEMCLE